jgi:Holliday junction resolvase
MVIPLEAAVVRRITRLLDARGAWWVKTTGVSKVGCPDLLVCYRGRFLAIEVKRSVESSYQLTPKQQHELRKIRKADGHAYVAYSEDDVKLVLAEVDAATEQAPGC